MSEWKIYHNPRCSKSREALALLEEKGIQPTVIEYLSAPLSEMELKTLISQFGENFSQIVRTKESAYKELNFDITSKKEICHYLAKFPILLERPIVVKDQKALVARPPEQINSFFAKGL